jgi:hypothetical protein
MPSLSRDISKLINSEIWSWKSEPDIAYSIRALDESSHIYCCGNEIVLSSLKVTL